MEALTVAKAAGLELRNAYEAIRISSGNSFVHETESQVILNGSRDISFTMDLVAKDITTNLFIALFPETVKSIKSSLKASIKSNWIDDLIFSIHYGHDEASLNYMSGSINTNEFLYQIDPDRILHWNLTYLKL